VDIRPRRNFVTLKPDFPELETSFGLMLPQNGAEKPLTATVLRVGAHTLKGKPIPLRPGQRVTVAKNSGVRFQQGDTGRPVPVLPTSGFDRKNNSDVVLLEFEEVLGVNP